MIVMDNKLKSKQELENKKLNVFIGKWHTTGDIYGKKGEVAGKVNAVDTYTWLPGEYAMIHYADSQMGDIKIHGIEIIGYDPERQAYFGPFFDNQGSVGSEELRLEDETWIWHGENVMGVKYHRCKAVFENENLIVARHEYSDDNRTWNKWMNIKLSKTD
jgi:hypothetical protein